MRQFPSNSQVLLKRRGYRDLLRFDLALRQLLTEICQAELPDNGSFLSFTHEGLQVQLVKGKRSRVTFMYRQEVTKTVKVALFYNRRFQRPSRNLLSWGGVATPLLSTRITASRSQ